MVDSLECSETLETTNSTAKEPTEVEEKSSELDISSPKVLKLPESISRQSLDINREYHGWVSHAEVDSRILFFSKFADEGNLNEMVGKLQISPKEAIRDMEDLVPGKFVLGKFEEAWYRAEIVEKSGAKMLYFVDYGNSEPLDQYSLEDLAELSEKDFGFPQYCIKCTSKLGFKNLVKLIHKVIV